MGLPIWLLRRLPMWEYFCPACRTCLDERARALKTCPACGLVIDLPLEKLRAPPRLLRDPGRLSDYVHRHVFPTLRPSERDWLAQWFTTIFSDGFENDFTPWTGTNGSITIETTIKHHGGKAARANASGEYCYKTVSGQTTIFTRMYIYFAGFGQAGYRQPILQHLNGSTGITEATELESGGSDYFHLRGKNGDSWEDGVYNAGDALSLSTWYCLEIKTVIHGSSGEHRMYQDGNEIDSLTGKDTDNAGNVDSVRCGISYDYGSPPLDHVFDCVVVADTGPIGQEEAIVEVTDSGSFTDMVLVDKAFTVPDSGAFSEAVSLAVMKLIADSGAFSEAVLADKELTVGDLGQLVDAAYVDKMHSVVDSGVFSEAVLVLGVWPGVRMEMSAKKRGLEAGHEGRHQKLVVKKRGVMN